MLLHRLAVHDRFATRRDRIRISNGSGKVRCGEPPSGEGGDAGGIVLAGDTRSSPENIKAAPNWRYVLSVLPASRWQRGYIAAPTANCCMSDQGEPQRPAGRRQHAN